MTAVSEARAVLYGEIDPFGVSDDLTEAELSHLRRLRQVLERDIGPLIPDAWEAGRTPHEVRAALVPLGLLDPPAVAGENGRESPLYAGFRTFELARCDLSVQILYNGQAGMFRSLVRECGSPEQFAAWDRSIAEFRMTGCFALTEPDHGSDVAGGLETTARREGDAWVLNGRKRWVGNAAISDHLLVIAREDGGDRILGFLVPRTAPGVGIDLIPRKIAARMVGNADISLAEVRVDEDRRLQRLESFADLGRALGGLRADVVWTAAGMQAGAFEAARRHTLERKQFGKPIAAFQLVQEKLARMLGNLASTLASASLVTRRPPEAAGASLAKLVSARHLRETAALGREIVGGDGVLLDHDVARFFVDAEAVYTFEGTHEINSLIVGRRITGISAFR